MDKENLHHMKIIRGEANVLSARRKVRALGELLSNNVQAQEGKRTTAGYIAAARGRVKRYDHIRAKVDTGLVRQQTPCLTRAPPSMPACSPASAPCSSVSGPARNPLVPGPSQPADQVPALTQTSWQSDLVASPELPPGVEDIDAADMNDPFLLGDYAKSIYRHLKQLEQKYPIKPDFMSGQVLVTSRKRATLVNWLVDLQLSFKFSHDTLQRAIGTLDRYLQEGNTRVKNFQLLGLAVLSATVKYEDVYGITSDDLVYMADGACTRMQLIKMERQLMVQLGFSLSRPIPLSFVDRFIKAAHGAAHGALERHVANFYSDLCLVEYGTAHEDPSRLAAAAVGLSLRLLAPTPTPLAQLWTSTLAYYSGYSLREITPLLKRMLGLAIKANVTKGAVFFKFMDESVGKVAVLPQLQTQHLQAIIRELRTLF